MKPNKRKVRKCLKCAKEFSGRFDFSNGKYLSIFLGFFCKNCQDYPFNFRYNCNPGQLNKEGGGELHEIKQSQDKTEIGKEHDKE